MLLAAEVSSSVCVLVLSSLLVLSPKHHNSCSPTALPQVPEAPLESPGTLGPQAEQELLTQETETWGCEIPGKGVWDKSGTQRTGTNSVSWCWGGRHHVPEQ